MELLVILVIGSIAMMALAAPFSAERSLWGTGKRQTEAQRDAQIALRAIARVAHESSAYAIAGNAITFTAPCGPRQFSLVSGNQLRFTDNCPPAKTLTLIDGLRSQVANFTLTPVITNRLVRIQLQVTNRLRTTDTQQRSELLITELYLRNAS